MKENEIRDYLSTHIEILNPHFEFLEKEKYIPPEICTKSFIDIFAVNKNNNRYVVIEIKRSDAATREALHELSKYFTAVKNHMALSSDELDLVVASTEWKELLIPFSIFVNNTPFSISGCHLMIEDGRISSRDITPIPEILDRLFGIAHTARYYRTPESLEKGIKSHEQYFSERLIASYVLIILNAPENYLEQVKTSTLYSYECMGIPHGEDFDKWVESQDFKYMIYSANLLQTKEKYLSYFKIKKEEIPFESIDEILNSDEMSELDIIDDLNTLLIEEIEPFPQSDHEEIGNSAKFSNFLEMGWEIADIKRYGTLNRNQLLEDYIIVEEILGSTGISFEKFQASIQLQDKANYENQIKRIEYCLKDNHVWRKDITEILDYLKGKQVKEIDCTIYNPMNIIYTIFLSNKYVDPSWFPLYLISFKNGEEEKHYIGYIDTNVFFKKQKNIINIMDTYFEDSGGFFISLTHGGYTHNNLKICKEIGIEYKSMLLEKTDKETIFYKLENHNFTRTKPIDISRIFLRILQDPQIIKLMEYIDGHFIAPGIFSFENSENQDE